MSGVGRGSRFNEGDWTCPECNNVNFARRSQCNRCGVERKYEVKKIKKGGIEIGKQAAEKSRGLFSAEDWMCKTCGNVNWARRNDCNMCNTPKVNIQEERTGYGGGFNERAGVEYKEKEDSDGEYDEFGRKKKKFRGSIGPNAGIILQKNETEEDEEEEDSGSDEDVSKYDLEADDDEEDDDDDTAKYDLEASDEEEDKKSNRSHKSRSRSRSRSRSKNGNRSSHSRSRSSSRSKRRHRSSSYSSDDSRGHKRHKHRHRHHKKKSSRSRSRSPHRRRHSSSGERHDRRH